MNDRLKAGLKLAAKIHARGGLVFDEVVTFEKMNLLIELALHLYERSRWRCVEKEPPEENVDVIATDGDVVGESWMDKDYDRWENEESPGLTFLYRGDYDYEYWHEVTHWQPLPDPPEPKS